MKQFKFLASMTLLALAASCSNEGIEQSSVATSPEGRPAANFVLSVNEESPETRAVFGNGSNGYSWYFETGDKIGAMLMDTWDGRGEGFYNFNIVDYAHTNYPVIKNEDGEWVCHEDINQLAGNYFFYFPYEPVTNARGRFGFSINPVQPQYNEAGDLDYWASVEQNQRYIGYNFVPVGPYTGEATEVKVDFAPLFAMPAFEFTNKAGDLIVDKIVVRATEDLDADMYDKDKNLLMATTMAFLPGSAGFNNVKGQWNNDGKLTDETNILWNHAIKYTSGVNLSESYVLPADPDMRWNATNPFYALNASVGDTYAKQSPAYEYVADYSGVEGGYVVGSFGKIRAILVMPAGSYNVDGFEAMIHVRPVNSPADRYVVRLPLDLESGSFDDLGDAAGHNFLAPGKTSKFYANFDAAAMKSYDIIKSQITSSEDLLWMVEEAEKCTGDYQLVVNTSGSRVVLTKEIEDILAAKTNIHLYINGKITIAADASEDAINKLYFDDKNVQTTLTIVNKQVAKKEIKNCIDIFVEKTGSLITGNNNITAVKVVNAGTISTNVLTAQVENTGAINANAIYGDVSNNGTVTVQNNIYGNVTNFGKLSAKNIDGYAKNKAGAELTVNGTVYGDVENNGTATIGTVAGFLTNYKGATATVNTTAEFNNLGKLNLKGSNTIIEEGYNEGSIDIKGAYTVESLINKGSVDVNADVTVLATGGVIENVKGTITVNATVYAKEEGIVKNYTGAVINVNGKLAEEVKNSGEIFVKGNGKVIVNGNLTQEVKGIIDVTEATGAETDAQKAMDYVTDEAGNAFRYVVKESSNAADLKAALLARISSNNFTTNDIIVLFDANKSVKYYGKYVNDPIPNIAYVKVVKGTTLTFTADGKENAVNFPQLDAENSQTVPEYKPFEVENGATLIVADKVVVTIPAVDVWVNGVFNVNDHAVLKGNAYVKGNGVTISTTAESNREWALGGTQWTGKDTGWDVKSNSGQATVNGTAYATLQAAVDAAGTDAVIKLGAGEYAEEITLVEGQNITLESASGDPTKVVFSGRLYRKNLENGKIVVKNVTITGANATTKPSASENYAVGTAIYDHYGKDASYEIDGCIIDLKDGCRLFKGWHSTSSLTVKNCKFVNSTVAPIQLNGVTTNVIENNEFLGTAEAAVVVSGEGGSLTFNNNTVASTYGILAHEDYTTKNWDITTDCSKNAYHKNVNWSTFKVNNPSAWVAIDKK